MYGVRRVFVKTILVSLQFFRCFFYRHFFSDNVPFLESVKLNQPAQFVGAGRITFRGVNIGVWPSPNFLRGAAYFEARSPGASIEVARGTFFNNGAVIIADRGVVKIGERCLIGLNFSAINSDFHNLSSVNRRSGNYECSDIFIGNDVFIGSDVRVLKGVRIGDGAVIGSGSLVVGEVPGATVYAGVPAKYIKSL